MVKYYLIESNEGKISQTNPIKLVWLEQKLDSSSKEVLVRKETENIDLKIIEERLKKLDLEQNRIIEAITLWTDIKKQVETKTRGVI